MCPSLNDKYIAGDDLFHHLKWIIEYISVFGFQNLDPKWMPDLNMGFGSPTFVFYGSFVYQIVSITYKIVNDIKLSLDIVCIVGLFLSAFFMYFLSHIFFPRRVSFYIGLFYLLFPYHIVDLFLRFAIAEFWSFCFLPLIIFSVIKYYKTHNKIYLLMFNIAYILLVKTHILVSFLFSLFLAFGLLFFLKNVDKKILKLHMNFLITFVLSLGVLAHYIIPMLVNLKFIRTDLNVINAGHISTNFLFSLNAHDPKFNFVISMIFLAQFLLIVFIGVFYVMNGIKNCNYINEINLFKKLVIISFISFVIISILINKISYIIWSISSFLTYIQFPWRLLTISSLISAFLCGLLFIPNPIKNNIVIKSLCILFILGNLLISLFIYLWSTNKMIPKEQIDMMRLKYEIDVPEYRPIWANIKNISLYSETFIDCKIKNNKCELTLTNVNKEAINLRIFYFPGWEATLDGVKRLKIMINKKIGNIMLVVPKGKHNITLEFGKTKEYFWSKIVSLISLLCLFSFTLFDFKLKIHKHRII